MCILWRSPLEHGTSLTLYSYQNSILQVAQTQTSLNKHSFCISIIQCTVYYTEVSSSVDSDHHQLGPVQCIQWVPQSHSVLTVAWRNGGVSLWTVFGSLLYHSLGNQPGLVRDAKWVCCLVMFVFGLPAKWSFDSCRVWERFHAPVDSSREYTSTLPLEEEGMKSDKLYWIVCKESSYPTEGHWQSQDTCALSSWSYKPCNETPGTQARSSQEYWLCLPLQSHLNF